MFDIIIPVYNTQVTYLKDCLESVENQTFSNWRCYIVNGTPKNSDRYEDIHLYLKTKAEHDSRFDYFLNEGDNTGVSAQRNIAIERGDNPYLVLLDSDDWLEPNWLNILEDNISDKYSIFYGRLRVEYVQEFNTRTHKIIAEYNRYSMSALVPPQYLSLIHI